MRVAACATAFTALQLMPAYVVSPDVVTLNTDQHGSEWSSADGVLTKVMYSPEVHIRPGQIIMQGDIPVDFIDEPAAVVNMKTDLVDAQGNSVPLSQAYMHHWLFEGESASQTIPGFGAGSEYRGLPEGFKKPFALMVGGDERWDATLHLLDLRMTPPELHLPSLECRRRIDCAEGPCLQPQVAMAPKEGKHGVGNLFDDYPGGLFCCDAGSE